jgi:hypothetical protein
VAVVVAALPPSSQLEEGTDLPSGAPLNGDTVRRTRRVLSKRSIAV